MEGVSMSEPLTVSQVGSLFDLRGTGSASADDIDHWIDRWHDTGHAAKSGSAQYEYLGLTLAEYQVWFYDTEALPVILKTWYTGRTLRDCVDDRPTSADRLETIALKGGRAWWRSGARPRPATHD